MLQLLLTAISALILTCAAEALTLPFVGALVRFRANYSPKGLQLDQEGGVQPHAGPVVNTYFAMLRRVFTLEGWRGLYKGFMPGVISTFLVTMFTYGYIGTSMPRGHGRYSAPAASLLQLLVYAGFLTLVGLPLTILFNRAVTTPYLLPWTRAAPALHRLFTRAELRRPWLLYLTPGLLLAKFLHLAYVIFVLRTFRTLLLPSVDALAGGSVRPGSSVPADFTPLRLGTYGVIAALSTVVLCPLEVLATRLSLQRNHAHGQGFEAVPQDEAAAAAEEEYAGTDDVIGLRNEFDPYVSFRDALKRMMEEEGWPALYRGWWLTLLALLMGTFV